MVMVLCIAGLLTPASAAAPAGGSPFRDFLIYYGGGRPLVADDAGTLSTLDLLVLDRFRSREIGGDTWKALRRKNPGLEILIYQDGPQVAIDQDAYRVRFLNNIGRYNSGRGLPAGSIAKDHPDWILRNDREATTRVSGGPGYVLLDFGADAFRRYWVDATVQDIVKQAWKADGVFMDDSPPFRGGAADWLPEDVPVRYADEDSWNRAMNGFVAVVSQDLHALHQRLMVNRGHSRLEEGVRAWEQLDGADSVPDLILEESAFAVSYGPVEVQFYPEEEWWRQVQAAARVSKSSVAYLSHAKLAPGDTGKDLQGNPVTFENVYTFALGSYLLALRADGPPSYFSFDPRRQGAFKTLQRLPLFDELDKLGLPLAGPYASLSPSAAGTVYRRDYSGAEVLVNPGTARLTIPVADGQQWRLNPDGTSRLEPVGGVLALGPHEAAIILRPAPQD